MPVPFPDTLRAKETESHRGEVAGPGPREQWPWSPGSWLGHLQGLPHGVWAGPRRAVAHVSFHSFAFEGFDTWKAVSAPIWTSAAKRSKPPGKVPRPQASLPSVRAPGDPVGAPTPSAHTDTPGREGGSSCQGGVGGTAPTSALALSCHGGSLV